MPPTKLTKCCISLSAFLFALCRVQDNVSDGPTAGTVASLPARCHATKDTDTGPLPLALRYGHYAPSEGLLQQVPSHRQQAIPVVRTVS